MSKLFDYGLEGRTIGILNGCDRLMDHALTMSGKSAVDLLGELDAETGSFLGESMTLYRESKELATLQARTMDNMLKKIEKLEDASEKLLSQYGEMQRMLQEINSKIQK